MQKGASRPGGRPLNCPHRARPEPIIHRKRHQKRYEDSYRIQGMDFVKLLAAQLAFVVALFLIWWFGGK